MSRIPLERVGFDSEFRSGVKKRCFLKFSDVDFGDSFQSPHRWFLHMLAEHLPVIFEWDYRKTADRRALPFEKAGRQPLSVPFVRTDRPDDVLLCGDRHDGNQAPTAFAIWVNSS